MISVIIPVLNEAKIIEQSLAQFKYQSGPFEVIVVDGGSTDQTRALAQAFPQTQVIDSAKGRAKQMNTGALAAQGEIFLFLHSDTFLPKKGLDIIKEAMQQPGAVGGFFGLQHETNNFWYNCFHRIINYYSNHTNKPYGDQAIFCSREAFARLNGYKDMPIMEDYDFSWRLGKLGRLVRLKEKVTGSFRRYEKGIIKYSIQCNLLKLFYSLGVPSRVLRRFYKDIR